MSDIINGVPRELLERITRRFSIRPHWDSMQQGAAIAELRALLTAQPQASAEIPFAGFDPNFCPGSNPDNPQTEEDEPEQASAAQSAPVVPAGWRLVMAIELAEEKHGSLRAAARALGIDAGYLSRLKKGEKVNPSEEVLAALGLERMTMYRASQQCAQSSWVPDGWQLVPKEPTAEMIEALAASFWPADWEAGKRLQRLRGSKVVFPKTEIEMAVGKYERVLTAAPAQPAAQGYVIVPVDPTPKMLVAYMKTDGAVKRWKAMVAAAKPEGAHV